MGGLGGGAKLSHWKPGTTSSTLVFSPSLFCSSCLKLSSQGKIQFKQGSKSLLFRLTSSKMIGNDFPLQISVSYYLRLQWMFWVMRHPRPSTRDLQIPLHSLPSPWAVAKRPPILGKSSGWYRTGCRSFPGQEMPRQGRLRNLTPSPLPCPCLLLSPTQTFHNRKAPCAAIVQ